ncbi:TetR family transcriptional regulator, partial [Pseudomonas aeruginosa]
REAVDHVGLGYASIGLIARLAGVSNGIVSQYFQDKNGLLGATMRHLLSALSKAVREVRAALYDASPGAHLGAIVEGKFDDGK